MNNEKETTIRQMTDSEITIRDLAKFYKCSGSAICEWLKKAGIRPIRKVDTGRGIPQNIYSKVEVFKGKIEKHSNRKRFREEAKEKEMIERICDNLGIKSSKDMTEKETFETSIIDLLCRIDENIQRLADALGGK